MKFAKEWEDNPNENAGRGSSLHAGDANQNNANDSTSTAAAHGDGDAIPTYTPPPISVFPEPLRQFIEAVALAKDIDVGMALPSVLAVLSSCVGNARVLRLRDDYHAPAVLWPVTVANSGDGKSPAMDAAMRPLIRMQEFENQEHAQRLQRYLAERKQWKSTPLDKRGEEPEPPDPLRHLYVSDCTVEGLAVRLGENRRGLLLAVDELNGWAKGMNAYKSGGNDRESYLAFYDARAAKIDRKTSDPPTIFVSRAFVALTGTIQPKILAGMLAGEAVDCGLAARLMLTMPPTRARVWRRTGIDPMVRDGYERVVIGLRNLSFDPNTDPNAITLTDAAVALWEVWHNEQQVVRADENQTGLRAAIPKLIDMAARLALIIHCVAAVSGEPGVDPNVLDETSMQAGITLARWYIEETRRIYLLLGIGEDRAGDAELIANIRRNGGEITVRQLSRGPRKYREPGAAERALEALARDGLATREPVKATGAGAPTSVYRLVT